jgi:thymidylate synthase
MNKLDLDYQNLLKDILENGVKKETRNGGTISVFGRTIRFKFNGNNFPLLTTKKMPFKTIVTELLWFLRGDTNIKYLVDNGCNIWNGDAYKNYCKNIGKEVIKQGDTFLDTKRNIIAVCKRKEIGTSKKIPILICEYEGCYIEEDCKKILSQEEFINKIKTDDEFANKWGELGPIYGKQWRNWTVPRMEPKGFDFDTAWEKSQKIWKSSNGMECGPSFETFCMSLLRSKKMGIAYGYHTQIDQIQNLINDLKTNPDSRRLMVNAWNVGELDSMVLPPCHYGFQVYTRELSEKERMNTLIQNEQRLIYEEVQSFKNVRRKKIKNCLDERNIPTRAISLMWNQRSVDTFLGLPFNIASYGLLLEIIAKEVNMVPDELIGNLGDVHLYSNHIEQAKEQIGREFTEEERLEAMQFCGMDALINGVREKWMEKNIPTRTRQPFPLPTLNINTEFWKTLSGECGVGPLDTNLQGFEISDFEIENYQSHPTIKAPLSN